MVDGTNNGYEDKEVGGSPVAEGGHDPAIELQRWRGNMINQLAARLGDATYAFLAVNFLFGVFQVIVIWRRVRQLRFRREQAETEFIEQLETSLRAADY